MSQLPTLRQLTYLNAVIKHRHFGQAAKACFVTQSTLSVGIQELEKLLGVQLVERNHRQIIPTRIGQEISRQAQTILSLAQDLVFSAQAAHNPMSGRIRIGIIPTISPFLLPKVLAPLRQALPDLETELLENTSATLLTQLHTGEIDVAVLAFPYDVKGLCSKIVAADPFWLALPPTHPLMTQQHIHSEQIPENELLLLTEGHCLREHAMQACQFSAAKQHANIQGTSLYTLIEMVASGLGITLIPEMAIHSAMVQQVRLGIRPLLRNNTAPRREIGLVWRPSYPRTKLIDQLGTHIAQALQRNR